MASVSQNFTPTHSCLGDLSAKSATFIWDILMSKVKPDGDSFSKAAP